MLYTLLLASIQPSTHSTYTASCKPRQGPWHSCWHMTLGRWWPQARGYPFQAEQLFPKKKRDSRSYKLVQSTFKHFKQTLQAHQTLMLTLSWGPYLTLLCGAVSTVWSSLKALAPPELNMPTCRFDYRIFANFHACLWKDSSLSSLPPSF